MDVAHVLRDILVVLIAAKLAAEVAERVGIPAVVGEIIAGIVIGPSVIGLVGAGDDVLRTLGEIGVILLLLEVGLEMDLGELSKVGRASLLVATVGVVAPLVLGFGAMEALGQDFNTSLFVAAALTATSVGITARVFGDLRALATTEARVVLGAAVADDVMGLVVLTVVVRLVTEGSVSVVSVAGIIAVAIGFLVLGVVVGLRVAPPLFSAVRRVSRSPGTFVAIALAFTLAFAQVAEAAKLAPIVGAFVAGIALGRTRERDRIGRELAPVGQLFIPVFFLQIGIDAEVDRFVDATVLRNAALLLAVAVVGKLLSPLGASRTAGDRWLIGLGMLPRGEVGLIFATIGLQSGVLDAGLYAALLVVVLVTTLASPQLLKVRYGRLRGAQTEAAVPVGAAPPDGWLAVVDGEVRLAATPPNHLGLPIALDAAVLVAHARPSSELLDWLAAASNQALRWDPGSSGALLEVVRRGNARSWRFLETVGVLDRALPELADTLRSRHADPYELDPLSTHRWAAIERLHARDPASEVDAEYRELEHPELVLLAALLVEALEGDPSPVATARKVAHRLSLGARAEEEIAGLIANEGLLWAAARQPDGMAEEPVLQLASYLDTPERARALFVLSAVRDEGRERWELDRVIELHRLVQDALAHDELTGLEARNLVGRRRAEAARVVGDNESARARIDRAPRAYVLRQDAVGIARQALLIDPLPDADDSRVLVTRLADRSGWWVDFVARDQPGLLVAVTGALADAGLDVADALVATWPDGAALESFVVLGDDAPDPAELRADVLRAVRQTFGAPPVPDATIEIDDAASPWHTVCAVRASDKPRLLHSLATAFAAAGVEVHSARITNQDGVAVDRFEVTERDGAKLGADAQRRVAAFVVGGVAARRRPLRRSFTFAPHTNGHGAMRDPVDPAFLAR